MQIHTQYKDIEIMAHYYQVIHDITSYNTINSNQLPSKAIPYFEKRSQLYTVSFSKDKQGDNSCRHYLK